MLLLRCPNCKNKMKYQPQGKTLEGKTKKCVYCPRTFNVRQNIAKT